MSVNPRFGSRELAAMQKHVAESDGQRWRRKNREDRAARERGVAIAIEKSGQTVS